MMMNTRAMLNRRTLLVNAPLGVVAFAAFSPSARGATAVDPSISALDNVRKTKRADDRAYTRLEAAEARAEVDLGRRPWSLIAWRQYSAIGSSELAGARDHFLKVGLDPAQVEIEFEAAKRRQRRAVRAGRDWDRRAGVTHLRRNRETTLVEYRRALWSAARTTPTTTAGAAAMTAWLSRELGDYAERYHRTLAKSIARGLRGLGKVVKQ